MDFTIVGTGRILIYLPMYTPVWLLDGFIVAEDILKEIMHFHRMYDQQSPTLTPEPLTLGP